jgi:hypothetical protein
MNQFEPPNPIAAFLGDVWIDAARHYGKPMTYEQEQLARQECARFSESQGFSGDFFWPTRLGAYDPLRPSPMCPRKFIEPARILPYPNWQWNAKIEA